MPELKGQPAIVTRASSGLGEATAVRLAQRGARVALLARTEADLNRVSARIRDAGGTAFALAADLADPAAVIAAAGQLSSGSRPPRVLINAAATDAPGPAEDFPLADWQQGPHGEPERAVPAQPGRRAALACSRACGCGG